MVLWEITLGTAYFLGLKRTYRLALRIQRRLISPKHPKIRQFAHRRTRAVFDVALKVHQNIQERDLEVGRNLGNWILRWLDKMKPSAQIRVSSPGEHPPGGNASTNMTKQLTNSSNHKTPKGFQKFGGSGDRKSDRHLFTSSRNILSKPFPSITMMMQPVKPGGTNIQNRHLSICGPEAMKLNYGRSSLSSGVIRKDILQWMLQN